jgi:hypothetical protein
MILYELALRGAPSDAQSIRHVCSGSIARNATPKTLMEKFTTMERYGLRVCGKSSNARGPKAADKLNLSHHSLLQKDASFRDAESLVQHLSGGASGAAIRKIFVRRGILASAKRNASDPSGRRRRQSGKRR